MFGFDMTVTSTVTYTLIERASGKTVWQKSVDAPFTAKTSDAFVGTERLRLANEGSDPREHFACDSRAADGQGCRSHAEVTRERSSWRLSAPTAATRN